MKIQAGDYMVRHENGNIGIFRPIQETQLLLELHFANGDSQLKTNVRNQVDFYKLALVCGKVVDLDITFVDSRTAVDPILQKHPAYRFSDAPLFDPTR